MTNIKKYNKICVLGAGLWGTALADQIARKGRPVWVWEYHPDAARGLQATRRHPHIPGFRIAPSITVSSDLGAAVRKSGLVLIVLPSAFVRETARRLRPFLEVTGPKPILVNASKGVEPGSLRTMGEAIIEELPFLAEKVFTVSGPSFAREVVRGVATKLVLAGTPGPDAAAAMRLIGGGSIHVEFSPDRIGVELGGSLKNVLAIGCGILDGLAIHPASRKREGHGEVTGANTKAALMTQGMAEMGRLIERFGGRRETIYGLAGLGDLFATGSSRESRNRALGEKLGRGKKLKTALREIQTVVEGVESAQSAHTLATASAIRAPLTMAIWRVVHRGASPWKVLEAMGFEGFDG
ncbi:MAG: hypothetical protein A2X36_00395 [Elusimicrobia bacterium GWA2_69_24]|nr:MAG: hypothetical protein A2X36_00395 [Elusimicrobia bacterium GWA2_69_24]